MARCGTSSHPGTSRHSNQYAPSAAAHRECFRRTSLEGGEILRQAASAGAGFHSSAARSFREMPQWPGGHDFRPETLFVCAAALSADPAGYPGEVHESELSASGPFLWLRGCPAGTVMPAADGRVQHRTLQEAAWAGVCARGWMRFSTCVSSCCAGRGPSATGRFIQKSGVISKTSPGAAPPQRDAALVVHDPTLVGAFVAPASSRQ